MLKEERKQYILNEVRLHNRVLLKDIAEMVDVSVDTIRRDVTELDKENRLKKVHGGAISLGFFGQSVNEEEVYALEEKRIIARKALNLFENNQVVLISGGTTNYEIAKIWPEHLKLTCFTPSIIIADLLAAKPNTEVILIGGSLDRNAKISVGGMAINILSEIRADLCFLGTNSIDVDNGITESYWGIVQMKKAMIRSSKRVVSPSISKKLKSVKRYQICDIRDIDILVTELDPNETELLPFIKTGLQVF